MTEFGSGDGSGAGSDRAWLAALDSSDNLYIIDGAKVRKVSAATGIVTTVAGNGTAGSSGDGGPATSAQIDQWRVAVDGAGNLYIDDYANSGIVIRKVTAATGIITTIAGNGTAGYSGDGGPAMGAQFGFWLGANVAVDGSGNVYVADADNNVIRMLVPMGTRALLNIASSHAGTFAPGQTGASYTVVVSNNAAAGPTNGTVTVTETLSAGLTLVSMSGAGWNCCGTARSFLVPQSGCGAPAGALAYSVNVTALPQGPLYYLTLWPTGLSQPLASTLNSWGGIVVANAAIVPAGAGGAVSVFVRNTADVILDINGYFDSSSGQSSFDFYPAAPCCVADTRYGSGQFSGPSMISSQPRDFPVPLSACSIPAWARAYSYQFYGGSAGVSGLSDHLAHRTGAAECLDAQFLDGQGGSQRRHRPGGAATNRSRYMSRTRPT